MVAHHIDTHDLNYTGEKQPTQADQKKYSLEPYFPSPELIDAVNLAIKLQKPLLIKGEPGCGKTRLARAVAYELGLYPDYYEAWYVKSTTRARDGLYTYDSVGRLRDAQLAAANRLTPEELAKSTVPATYVHYGHLGKAFRKEKRCVVLIDEIDKADLDFPNDLLLELDERRFFIEELEGEEVPANKPPIVFITSNDEKDLPDAFLRRCLFHYIEFPERKELVQILGAHFPTTPADLVDTILDNFLQLREEMKKGQANKKVSTSELLDWCKVLSYYRKEGDLEKITEELLYPGVLLKSWDDYQRYTQLMRKERTANEAPRTANS